MRPVRRAVCVVLRHRPVTVIDQLELLSAAPGPAGPAFRVAASHRRCRRCHKDLP